MRAVFALLRTPVTTGYQGVHRSVNAARKKCMRYGGVFMTFGGPAGPWELRYGRGSEKSFVFGSALRNRDRKGAGAFSRVDIL